MLIDKPRIPIRAIVLYGFLPGFLKRWIYRWKGYRIGRGVSIGLGAVVCGESVEIGAGTSIGFLTIIRGKSIKIGSRVSIGALTFLDTPFIEIGDGSRINEQVFVGGLQFPDSRFSMGRNCQIMQMSFINPAKSVTMGDDSGIGGHCLVFGHNSWLSQFEGYPVEFQPIEIGRSVSVAWGAFLLPGTVIGDGSVVGAHSLVNRSIPPRSLAVGYPARVVSSAPDFPKSISPEEKVNLLKRIVEEMMSYFRGHELRCAAVGDDIYQVSPADGRAAPFALHVLYGVPPEKPEPGWTGSNRVVLSLRRLPVELRRVLSAAQVSWLDVEAKEQSDTANDLAEEVAAYLRRYGVRLLRDRGPERVV